MLSSFNAHWSPSNLLPTPEELWQRVPLTLEHQELHKSFRQTIKNILSGIDPRFLLIVGPCSIHDTTAAKEYATKLKHLSCEVEESLFLVMRTYFEKPRSTTGWKGLLYDPYINESHNIYDGLFRARQLLSDITEKGVPTATEFLDPSVPLYLADFISWGCIGARTVASQIHRQMASSLSIPVGFKNGIDGSVEVAVKGAKNAQNPHSFLGMNPQGRISKIQTLGNNYTHLVLRGGESRPNYDEASVQKAVQCLTEIGINPRLLIDCSHDNCGKRHQQQIPVFKNIIDQCVEGNPFIVGSLLESNLEAGCQQVSSEVHKDISITDPCIDWETTEELILKAHHRLSFAKRCLVTC